MWIILQRDFSAFFVNSRMCVVVLPVEEMASPSLPQATQPHTKEPEAAGTSLRDVLAAFAYSYYKVRRGLHHSGPLRSR